MNPSSFKHSRNSRGTGEGGEESVHARVVLIVDLCIVSISGVKFRRYSPSFVLIARPASAAEGNFPRELSVRAFVKLEEEILS